MALKPVDEDKPVKKGRPSWRPFRKLDVANKDPNYRYRWALRDAANIEKKLNEGWKVVDAVSGIKGNQSYPNLAADGKTLDSTATYREHVLMALPAEDAEARDAYYQELTDKRTGNLVKETRERIREEAGRGAVAPVHGTITIS